MPSQCSHNVRPATSASESHKITLLIPIRPDSTASCKRLHAREKDVIGPNTHHHLTATVGSKLRTLPSLTASSASSDEYITSSAVALLGAQKHHAHGLTHRETKKKKTIENAIRAPERRWPVVAGRTDLPSATVRTCTTKSRSTGSREEKTRSVRAADLCEVIEMRKPSMSKGGKVCASTSDTDLR